MVKNSVLVLFLVLLLGCGPVNPLAPIGILLQVGIYWVNGEAHKYYNCDQQTLCDATKSVIKDLGMVIETEEVQSDHIYIRAHFSPKTDRVFKIKVAQITDKVSKLSIRIGTWGDKPFAELFYAMTDSKPNVNDFKNIEALEAAFKRGGIRFQRISR